MRGEQRLVNANKVLAPGQGSSRMGKFVLHLIKRFPERMIFFCHPQISEDLANF
jgi:hypothetical protein